jgi:hypothetical protein
MPHGGGHRAMMQYLWSCGDVGYIMFQNGAECGAIDRKGSAIDERELTSALEAAPNKYFGLLIDRTIKLLPREIVNLAVPEFPLFLLCRDAIGYVTSNTNHFLRVWADYSSGLAQPSLSRGGNPLKHPYGNFPADLIVENAAEVLSGRKAFLSDIAYWHKVFAALRAFAGPVAVVDFSEFITPGAIPEIMRRVGTALFNNPAAWNGLVVESHLYSSKNLIWCYDGILKLRLTDTADRRFSCSLLPRSHEFWKFEKQDAGLVAACYPPEAIGWRVGDFKGDLCFVCDEREIAASGLSKEEFVRRAGTLLEAEDRKPLLEYTREMNVAEAKADELFDKVRVSPEQVMETIRKLGSPTLERYREVIRSQAEELASVGVDVTERWTHARELLGPEGFSRPPEQRYSHLRELNCELLQMESERYADLEQDYKRLQSSLSWKLTRPVREIERIAKKMKRILRKLHENNLGLHC